MLIVSTYHKVGGFCVCFSPLSFFFPFFFPFFLFHPLACFQPQQAGRIWTMTLPAWCREIGTSKICSYSSTHAWSFKTSTGERGSNEDCDLEHTLTKNTNSIRISSFELRRVLLVPSTLPLSVHSVQLGVLLHSLPEAPHGVRTVGQGLGQRSATAPAPCQGHGKSLWWQGGVWDWKKTNTIPFNFRADISDCACTKHALITRGRGDAEGEGWWWWWWWCPPLWERKEEGTNGGKKKEEKNKKKIRPTGSQQNWTGSCTKRW